LEGAVLQACLNGGLPKQKHSNLPVTASELAADALSVRKAGADELHIHIRDFQGVETLNPVALATALTAIRNAVPGMAVGIGTGAWIAPGGRARHSDMQAWSVLPDYCSVNLNEEDAVEVIDLLHSRGIGIEAGLWNLPDAQRFVREVPFDRCLRVLIEMTSDDEVDALTEAVQLLDLLAHADCNFPFCCMAKVGVFGHVFAKLRAGAYR
jgi:uncharacterized protein (DUF849 family)